MNDKACNWFWGTCIVITVISVACMGYNSFSNGAIMDRLYERQLANNERMLRELHLDQQLDFNKMNLELRELLATVAITHLRYCICYER